MSHLLRLGTQLIEPILTNKALTESWILMIFLGFFATWSIGVAVMAKKKKKFGFVLWEKQSCAEHTLRGLPKNCTSSNSIKKILSFYYFWSMQSCRMFVRNGRIEASVLANGHVQCEGQVQGGNMLVTWCRRESIRHWRVFILKINNPVFKKKFNIFVLENSILPILHFIRAPLRMLCASNPQRGNF